MLESKRRFLVNNILFGSAGSGYGANPNFFIKKRPEHLHFLVAKKKISSKTTYCLKWKKKDLTFFKPVFHIYSRHYTIHLIELNWLYHTTT